MHLYRSMGVFNEVSIKTLTKGMLFLDRDLHWKHVCNVRQEEIQPNTESIHRMQKR